MSRTAGSEPEWFKRGNPLIWLVARATYDHFEGPSNLSSHHKHVALCASIHYIHCLNLSTEVNRKGQHAVAICLIRQCVEALNVIEIGMLRERAIGENLLRCWGSGAKTLGSIRKDLEAKVWPRYGTGLWGETWTSFFGEFCKAVQPYVHYSKELQSWQLQLLSGTARTDENGKYLLLGKVGLNTYEASKAIRVNMLHCLLSWVLGRIMIENIEIKELNSELEALGKALAGSEELCGGALNWPQQFWAHEFNRPEAETGEAETGT